MRVTPNWLELYAPVENGILPDALVAYGKRLITHPDDRFPGYGEYQHTLAIHLFIVTLRFDWRRFE